MIGPWKTVRAVVEVRARDLSEKDLVEHVDFALAAATDQNLLHAGKVRVKSFDKTVREIFKAGPVKAEVAASPVHVELESVVRAVALMAAEVAYAAAKQGETHAEVAYAAAKAYSHYRYWTIPPSGTLRLKKEKNR
jgi:hypothetical protein